MREVMERTMNLTNAILLGVVYLISTVLLLSHLQMLLANGGGPFAQGDWLVNLDSGLVRRGAAGALLLHISDITGIAVLSLLIAIQSVLVLAVAGAIVTSALATGLPDRLVLILVSPLLITFWAVDPAGAFRKEILGIVAFIPLLFPGRGWTNRLIGAVVVWLFAIAVVAHEGNAFFAPALLTAAFIRFRLVFSTTGLAGFHGAMLIIAATGLVFAALNPSVDDTTAMCAALTSRGLSPEMCGGAVFWMGDTFGITRGVMANMMRNYGPLSAMLTFSVLLIPLILAFFHAPRPRVWGVAGAILFVGFLPLYAVAVDWGRWMSMYMFSMAFLTLVIARNTHCQWLYKPVRSIMFVPLLVMSLSLGVFHYAGLPMPGFAQLVFGMGLDMVQGGQ